MKEFTIKAEPLLRCPFCGGEAELMKGLCELDNYVMCLDCRGNTKFYNTKESAIKACAYAKAIEIVKGEKDVDNHND